MCHTDNSIFVWQTSNAITVLIVYVDDILITSSNPTYITSLINSLHNQFAIHNLGQVNQFLGIDFQLHPSRVGLS